MDEKTKEILEKAAAVFLRFGIKSVTMDDMARELGISKKTLYVHFKDKNELVLMILASKVEEDQDHCCMVQKESENAIDELIGIIQFVIENMGKINPSVFMDLQKYHADAWAIIHKHKSEFIFNVLSKNIERGVKEGIYREELLSDIVARLFIGMTDLLFDGKTFPWPEYKLTDLYQTITSFQIHGMANEKGLQYLNNKINNQ